MSSHNPATNDQIPPQHRNGATHTTDDAPRSTRELAHQVEMLTAQVSALLRLSEMARTRAEVARTLPQPRDLIMQLLSTAKAGQPGYMNTVELAARTGLGKSSVWHHIADLADRGQVVILRGKRGENGKRGPDVVYHADAIAI